MREMPVSDVALKNVKGQEARVIRKKLSREESKSGGDLCSLLDNKLPALIKRSMFNGQPILSRIKYYNLLRHVQGQLTSQREKNIKNDLRKMLLAFWRKGGQIYLKQLGLTLCQMEFKLLNSKNCPRFWELKWKTVYFGLEKSVTERTVNNWSELNEHLETKLFLLIFPNSQFCKT